MTAPPPEKVQRILYPLLMVPAFLAGIGLVMGMRHPTLLSSSWSLGALLFFGALCLVSAVFDRDDRIGTLGLFFLWSGALWDHHLVRQWLVAQHVVGVHAISLSCSFAGLACVALSIRNRRRAKAIANG